MEKKTSKSDSSNASDDLKSVSKEIPSNNNAEKNNGNPIVLKSSDHLYYQLNDGRKKVALIFNHREYKHFTGRKPSTRIGTNKDLESLKKCLKILGFTVKPYQNPKKDQIFDAIKEVSGMKNTDVCCVMVVVLTHGENNVLYASDQIYSQNRIIKPIVGSTSLSGIPKLFVFQACRGKLTDEGHDLETDGEGPDDDPPVIIMNADYLCMYSSVENYLSWREENGSWLIQTLCHNLEVNWKSHDLIDILTLVNQTMAYEKVTDTYVDYDPNSYLYHNKKGMSQIESTLTKFINFTK